MNRKEKPYLPDGVGAHLPAVSRALELQKRAAAVGFDWDSGPAVLAKMDEELSELKEAIASAQDARRITEELGDLLFCCVNLARHFHIDPELALSAANEKFIRRFNHIESGLKASGKRLDEASLEEMERLWQEAKREAI